MLQNRLSAPLKYNNDSELRTLSAAVTRITTVFQVGLYNAGECSSPDNNANRHTCFIDWISIPPSQVGLLEKG